MQIAPKPLPENNYTRITMCQDCYTVFFRVHDSHTLEYIELLNFFLRLVLKIGIQWKEFCLFFPNFAAVFLRKR